MTVMIRTQNYSRRHRSAGTRPGAVAGAVLRAARRSAHASTNVLASTITVPRGTITSWENGTLSLANQSVPSLQRLEAALAGLARHLPPATPITSKTLTERTGHAITTARPALAAACLPPPAPLPAWQREETRHRYRPRDPHSTGHCAVSQPRQPQRRVNWTCQQQGRRIKRDQ